MSDSFLAGRPWLRVCIVGAGVSGLVAAKIFKQEGHAVTVFERDGELGGVWAPQRVYPGLTTQTPGDQYAFSDFPVPADYPEWPSARQVRRYLHAYAQNFGVAPLIRYRSTVVNVKPRKKAESGWSVTVERPDGRHTSEFDFLLVCNGTFSTPNRPKLPGVEPFTAAGGMVRHTSECGVTGLFQDKRVVVVGYGKSAMDIAVVAASRAKEMHLVVRRAIWPVPKLLGGLLPVRWLCTSRLWEALIPRCYPILEGRAGRGVSWRRLLPMWWRVLEMVLSRQFRLKDCGLRPPHRFADQVASGFQLAPDKFFHLARAGRIHIHHAGAAAFSEYGLVLSDNRMIAADLVVLGTGYRQGIPFLDPALRARIVDQEGRYRLHRYLLSPEVPGLGFVGYNSSLFTPITSELGARWLAAYTAGRLSLPTRDEMNRRIDAELTKGKAVRPLSRRFTGIAVAPYTYSYLDDLLADLGRSESPRAWRAVRRFLKSFEPSDYGF